VKSGTRLARTVCRALACVVLAVSCGDDNPGQPPDGSVRTLEVTPANAWLVVGGSLSLAAVAKDSAGEVATEPVTWSSSDLRIVSVGSDGVVRAVAPGTATILAQAGGVRTNSTITVTTAPASLSWSVEKEGITDASLLGAWADASSALTIAVGQFGVILESTGSGWQLIQQPPQDAFTGVWGSNATNVFAVATSGLIYRRTGTGWSRMQSPTTNTLLDVWGRSATEV